MTVWIEKGPITKKKKTKYSGSIYSDTVKGGGLEEINNDNQA